MKKLGMFLCIGAVFSGLTVCSEETKYLPPRTPAETKQGKENVQQVVKELAALFSADSIPVIPDIGKQAAPAFCRIISSSQDRATLIYQPRFTTVKQLFKAVDGIIQGKVNTEMLQEQNMILLNAPAKEIQYYLEIIKAMDIPSSHILVEAKIVEITYNDGMQRNFSFVWNNKYGSIGASAPVPSVLTPPTSGARTNWSYANGSNQFDVSFRWLLTALDAKILSSPTILVARNEVSKISAGNDLPIQEAKTTSSVTSVTTKFKNTGVSLEVEPIIINDDNVTIRLSPSVSYVSSYTPVVNRNATYTVPTIDIRNVETHLRLRDKQVAMFGGLYTDATRMEQNRIPFVSDIPYIGELLTGKNYKKEITQLIFFIKVHIFQPRDIFKNVIPKVDQTVTTTEILGDLIKNSPSMPEHSTSVENLLKEMKKSQPSVKKTK